MRTVGLTALPHTIAAGDGTLWLGNGYDGTLSRLELADGLLSPPFRPQPGSTGRLALATGFGSVWVGSQDDVIARLDPATQALRSTIKGVDNPEAIAAGAGAVWVLPSSRRAVLAIDPRLNRTVASIPLGDPGKAIAVTDDAVWVLGERRLWRIDPKRRLVTATVGLRSPATALAAGEGAVGRRRPRRHGDPHRPRERRGRAHDPHRPPHRRPPRRRRRAVGGGALS